MKESADFLLVKIVSLFSPAAPKMPFFSPAKKKRAFPLLLPSFSFSLSTHRLLLSSPPPPRCSVEGRLPQKRKKAADESQSPDAHLHQYWGVQNIYNIFLLDFLKWNCHLISSFCKESN